jgi:hypothetical protein
MKTPIETGYGKLQAEMNKPPKRISKTDLVKAYLIKHKSITPMDALKPELRMNMRLSDSIFRLRKQGWIIITELVPTSDGSGEYARYHYKGTLKEKPTV